jgi:8-oxo-dGTP diphosphatase
LEAGETWDDGLAREVWEETGLEVHYVCEVRDWESSRWHTLGHTVLCEYQGGDVQLSWEHTEYHWLTFEEVDQGDFPQWIREDIASARDKLGQCEY